MSKGDIYYCPPPGIDQLIATAIANGDVEECQRLHASKLRNTVRFIQTSNDAPLNLGPGGAMNTVTLKRL